MNEEDYVIIPVNEELQFVRKVGTAEIVSANVNGRYVLAKDFDEQLQARAHAVVRQYNFWGLKEEEK
jgi:hypothetical protein